MYKIEWDMETGGVTLNNNLRPKDVERRFEGTANKKQLLDEQITKIEAVLIVLRVIFLTTRYTKGLSLTIDNDNL